VLERQIQKHEPIAGVIVATFLGYDFHDCVMIKGNVRDGLLGNEQTLRAVLKRNSHLYRLAANAYHHLPSNKLEYRPHEWELYHPEQWTQGPLKRPLEIYSAEMLRIHELCDAEHLPVLAVIIPSPRAVQIADGSHRPEPGEQFDLPTRYATAAFESAHMPVLDLTPALAHATMARTYFGWDEHLNPLGNRVVADAILAQWKGVAR
jgi:hypothetical protein